MQSLIDNPNLESLDTPNDKSDESDIDLDFEPLNQVCEELIESSESTDSVDLESGNSPSGCKWVSTPTPVEVYEFREYTGVKCDLPPNAEPKDYFDLFFSSITVRSNYRANKQICREADKSKTG